MAHIIMSHNISEDITKKTDMYLNALFEGKQIGYNLDTLKKSYHKSVTNDVMKNYDVPLKVAQRHATALINTVIDYRVSIVNC